MGLKTGYIDPNGRDIGDRLIEKSYLLDRYPELANTLKQSGLWLWGLNDNGEIGDNTVARKSSPVQTVAGGSNWKIISPNVVTAAIKTDGTLWLWGAGSVGQLGDNSVSSKSSPVQTISGGSNWVDVVAINNVVGGIKTDGTLWTWGFGNAGAIGNNSRGNISSPVQTVAGGTNWKQIAGCGSAFLAIKTDGTLWGWGDNVYSVLGDNTDASRSSPVQTVAGGTNWKQVFGGYNHCIATKTDGTLWLWGSNIYGELGDNTSGSIRSSPIQTVAGGTNWKQASGGAYYSAAIKTDGSLWTWGYNTSGELGNNSNTNTSSPVQTVSGGTNWKQIAAGSGFTAAIKTDGSLWTWGSNFYGTLGNNLSGGLNYRSSPIQTVAGGTNWTSVNTKFDTIAAIKDNYFDTF